MLPQSRDQPAMVFLKAPEGPGLISLPETPLTVGRSRFDEGSSAIIIGGGEPGSPTAVPQRVGWEGVSPPVLQRKSFSEPLLTTFLDPLLEATPLRIAQPTVRRAHTDDHPEPEFLASSVGKEINGRMVPSSSVISLLSLGLPEPEEDYVPFEEDRVPLEAEAFVTPETRSLREEPFTMGGLSPPTFKHFTEDKLFFLEPDYLSVAHVPAQPRANSISSLSRWNTRVNLKVQQQRNPTQPDTAMSIFGGMPVQTGGSPALATEIAPSDPFARPRLGLSGTLRATGFSLTQGPERLAPFAFDGPHPLMLARSIPDSPNLDPISVGGSPSSLWLNPPTPISSHPAVFDVVIPQGLLSPTVSVPLRTRTRTHAPAAIDIPTSGDKSPTLLPVETPSEAPIMTPLQLSAIGVTLGGDWGREEEPEESDGGYNYYDGTDEGPAVEL